MTLQALTRDTSQTHTTTPERIIQFGGGNFLRAFIDWIIQDLNDNTDFSGQVVIVKPTPRGTYAGLDAQEGLFHVRLHGMEDGTLKTEQTLITCVSRSFNPYTDFAAYIALAQQPDIRFIFSNTTEAGIVYNENDQLTDEPPASFPAKMTVFLYRRWQHFSGTTDKGCIIFPCELIEQNGDKLRDIILQYADQWTLETDFKTWVNDHNVFCNTLVDRIVTGFPEQNTDAVLQEIGYNDQLVVEGEQYHSWIIQAPAWIQDEFPVNKTNLNIKIVDDLTPYREIKVRILNGAHTSMVPVGYLLGLETVLQAVEHPQLGKFIEDLLYKEVIPTLDFPEDEKITFAGDVLNRFRNPFLQHKLISISLNSTSKFKTRLLPTLLASQTLPERIVIAFAALIRFYKGAWYGESIPLKDDPAVLQWFADVWSADITTHERVTRILQNESLWEQDLSQIEGLAAQLTVNLDAIENDGIDAVITCVS